MKEKSRQYLGFDIGTSRLVVARPSLGGAQTETMLNAFIEVPDMPATVNSLKKHEVQFLRHNGVLLAYGQHASVFAELFHADLRRPMRNGVVNLQEPANQAVLLQMITSLAGEPAGPATLGYSVPSSGIQREGVSASQLTHHRSAIDRIFTALGYEAHAIVEAEALIYSELEENGYSGLAISFGAGLTNVAMTYLSVPVLDFSISRGGDSIDIATAEVLGEKASRVRLFKENEFSLLSDNTSDSMTRTVKIFYSELIEHVVAQLANVLVNSNDVPRLREPIPVVIGGGTSMPPGFVRAFEKALREYQWPFPISHVRHAKDPLNAVARGLLRYVQVNFASAEEASAAAG